MWTLLSIISLNQKIRFLSSSVDSLVKNLCKDDFKYLIHEFDNNILNIENCLAKKSLIDLSPTGKLWIRNMNILLIFPQKNEMKMMKHYHDLYLNCHVLLLAALFEKL